MRSPVEDTGSQWFICRHGCGFTISCRPWQIAQAKEAMTAHEMRCLGMFRNRKP